MGFGASGVSGVGNGGVPSTSAVQRQQAGQQAGTAQPLVIPLGPASSPAAGTANGLAAPGTSGTRAYTPRSPNTTRQSFTAMSGDGNLTRSAPNGPWTRGWISVEAERTQTGVRVIVESAHQQANDPVKLVLQARVRAPVAGHQQNGEPVFEERIVPIAVMHDGPLNTSSSTPYDAVNAFEIDLAAVQAWLKAAAPNANLVLDATTPLAVDAFFQGGHRWGGFARAGTFNIPWTQVQTSAQRQSGATVVGAMPLDMAVKYSDQQVQSYQGQTPYGAMPVLLKGGQFSSRVESEVKVSVPLEDGPEVGKRLFELVKLARDPRAAQKRVEQLFGKGWSMELKDVERFYVKDQNDDFVLDQNGLPEVHPMLDRYFDSPSGKLAEKGVALRFRETPKDQDGLVNIKLPSPENLPNPTKLVGLIGRLDTGTQTVKGVRQNPQAMIAWFRSNDRLNAFQPLRKLIPGLDPAEVLHPASDQSAKRIKVTLVHTSGTKIEVSFDHVAAMMLNQDGTVRIGRDGKPMVGRSYQLELDLEHLQTTSTNVVIGPQGPVYNQGSFEQDLQGAMRWLGQLGPGATLAGPARVHGPEDVTNPAIVESEAYKLLLDVGPKLHQWLLKGQARAAGQKYAEMARIAGAVAMTPGERQRYADETDMAIRVQKHFEASSKEAEKVLAEAKAEGDKIRVETAKLLQTYHHVNGALSNVRSALQNLIQYSQPHYAQQYRQYLPQWETQLASNLKDFETRVGEARALLDGFDGRGKAVEAMATADEKRLDQLEQDVKAARDAFDIVMTALRGGDNQVMNQPQYQKDAQAFYQAAQKCQIHELTQQQRFAGFASAPLADAEAKVTKLRSDALWKAIEAADAELRRERASGRETRGEAGGRAEAA